MSRLVVFLSVLAVNLSVVALGEVALDHPPHLGASIVVAAFVALAAALCAEARR